MKSNGEHKVIALMPEEFGLICICAVRYALGRQSYMPSLIQSYLKPRLPLFTDKDLSILERDIEEADKFGGYGDTNIDKPDWLRFLAAIKAEKIRRNS